MKGRLSLKNMSDQQKAALSIGALQGLYFASVAFLCYSSVYLKDIGFTPSLNGALTATLNCTGIVASMFWGRTSDKINSVKKVLLILATITFISNGIIPFLPVGVSYTIPLFFAYYAISTFFTNPTPAILDNMAIRTCAVHGVNYGATRSMGSLTYGIVSLIAAAIVTNFGIHVSFFTSALFGIPFLIILFFAYDPKVEVKNDDKKAKKNSMKPLFKNYYYMTFLVFAVLYFISASSEMAFLAYFMEDVGINTNGMGTYLTFKALLQVPVLVFCMKIRKKVKLKYMIFIACALMATECFGFGLFTTNLPTMMFFGGVYGVGQGFFLAGVSPYLFKLAPDNLKATAQTTYTSVCAASSICGSLIGGRIFELVGGQTFYVIVGFMMLFSAVVLIVTSKLKPHIPNPADELV